LRIATVSGEGGRFVARHHWNSGSIGIKGEKGLPSENPVIGFDDTYVGLKHS